MKKDSLLKSAWKNRKLILEGLINKVQAKEEVTKIAEERRAICMKCPMHSTNARKFLGYQTERFDEHCTMCGCNIDLKVHSLHSECPDKPPRWNAVVGSIEEDMIIKEYINPTNNSSNESQEKSNS